MFVFFFFIEKHNAVHIAKDKTCFKSLVNPSYIDLFIINRPRCFQNTTVFSTGLSKFHKMAVTVLKTPFSKATPKEMFYRDYKNFDKFKYELKNRTQNESVECFSEFAKAFVDIVNEHTPLKRSSYGLIMLLI